MSDVLKYGHEARLTEDGTPLVHDADIHDKMINRYAANYTATVDTLNGAVVANAYQIVTNAATFANGDWLEIQDNSIIEPNFCKVIAGGGTANLTLDRHLDNAYSDGADVTKVNIGLHLANGSIGTPVIYKVQPPSNQVWHIWRCLLSAQDGTDTDLGKFSGIAALTNGIQFRTVVNDVYRTSTSWKNGADIVEDAYDWDPSSAAPAGTFGMAVRWTIQKAGAYIRLDGAMSDRIEMLVMDDLTDLTDLQIKWQGHTEVI